MIDDRGRKVRHFRIPSRISENNPPPPSWLPISRRRGHLLARLSAIAESFGVALFVTEANDLGGGFAQYEHNYICLSQAAATHRLDNRLLSVFFHELGHFVLYRLGRYMRQPKRASVRTRTQLTAALKIAIKNEKQADAMGKTLMESNFPGRKGAYTPGYQTRADFDWLKEKIHLSYGFPFKCSPSARK